MRKRTAGEQPAKKKRIRICYECGKAIMPEDPAEHITTRRRTELWFHKGCVTGRKDR